MLTEAETMTYSSVIYSPINDDVIQRLCDQDDTILCLNRDNRNTTSVDQNDTHIGITNIGNVLHQVSQVPIYTANCTAVRLLETDI